MIEIVEIKESALKQTITQTILNDLPAWFGIEEAIKTYVEGVKPLPFFAAKVRDQYVGFYALREENAQVIDMYVLGVLKAYHHKGIGQKLQAYVDQYAKKKGYTYLMVLTLAKKAQNPAYLKTRQFYLKVDFFDFYQNDKIFSKEDPCQIMIKAL